VLSVEDDGPGIDDEVARRMFEPFFTTRATGTGIGLAVVRRVVDASSGRVEIGRSPSGGGRISLVFPAFRSEG
jgi:signal transduction histidine kinase